MVACQPTRPLGPPCFRAPCLLLPLLLVGLLAPSCRAKDYARLFSDGGSAGEDSSKDEFDCFVGFLECSSAWSGEKQAWCLEHKDVRCPGAEEQEGEHKTRSKLIGMGMAWMLLGSVAFVMALFYLVNWPDDDIRRYSWSIISATISIFMVVLIFQGVNEIVFMFIPRDYDATLVFVMFFMLIIWFVLTSLTVAIVSGANFEGGHVDLGEEVWIVADTMRDDYGDKVPEESVRQPVGKKAIAIIGGVEAFVRRGKHLREEREKKMRCWATLFAHMTGFAAISLGARIQHFPVFTMNPFMTVVVVLMIQLLFTGLFRIATEVRKRTEALDGVIDERDHLYDEYTEEAEIDAASLSVSFLLTQAMRYWLTGILPNEVGEEFPEVVHSLGSILSLYGAGGLLAIASIVLPIMLIPPYEEKHARLRRFVDTLQNQGLMTFAWCFYFATNALAIRSQVLEPIGGPHSMGGRVVLALGVSFLAFLAIFGLDKIEDAAKAAHEDVRRVSCMVKANVNTLGILVGFSWEESFEGASSAVASLHPRHAYVVKLVLAIAVALVLIPAWRQFVLEKVMMYKRLAAEEMDARSVARRRTGVYEQLELTESG